MILASIYGRLSREPKPYPEATQVITASIVVDVSTVCNGPGEAVVSVEVVGFGEVGDVLARYSKGEFITVIGRLSIQPCMAYQAGILQSWETWEVWASDIYPSRPDKFEIPGAPLKRHQR